jgi:hypothetical protein
LYFIWQYHIFQSALFVLSADAATTATGAGDGVCGEPMMTTRVSNRVGANPSHFSFPLLFLPFLSLVCMVCCESVCNQRTHQLFSFSGTRCLLACRHRGPAQAPISRLAPRPGKHAFTSIYLCPLTLAYVPFRCSSILMSHTS